MRQCFISRHHAPKNMDGALSVTPTGLSRGNVQLWIERPARSRVMRGKGERGRGTFIKRLCCLLDHHVVIFIQIPAEKLIFLECWTTHEGIKKKKKSEVGRDVESQQTQTGRNTDTMKGVNRQKTQRIAFLTGFNVSPHPYHLWRREIIRRVEEPLTHTNKVSSRRVLFKLINKQSKIIWGNVLNLKRRRQQSEFKGR